MWKIEITMVTVADKLLRRLVRIRTIHSVTGYLSLDQCCCWQELASWRLGLPFVTK
jgi:hypothetical protein